MKKELDEKLTTKHPIIFKDRHGDMSRTSLCWGYPGSGWYDLINKLCFDIEKIMEKNNVIVTAVQVKEKFGGLRFYVDISDSDKKETFLELFENIISKFLYKHRLGKWYWRLIHFRQWFYMTSYEKIHKLINAAEHKSYTICEKCGDIGKQRGGGWIVTLCDTCNNKRRIK